MNDSTRRSHSGMLRLWGGVLVGVSVLITSGCAVWRIGQSIELARRSEPLQQSPPGATIKLLIVGDSTAVGTGAASPASSLGGRIAAAYPFVRIENRATDGAKFADVAKQLDDAKQIDAELFDVVLVQAGGNDVIRLTGEEKLRADIDRVAELAKARARTVILMPAGNVGNAPFFFRPLAWWMTQRSRTLHALVSQAAVRTGAVYVNLFQERAEDPFVKDPSLNASDGLHPSDAGYGVWYQVLRAQGGLDQKLGAPAAPPARQSAPERQRLN